MSTVTPVVTRRTLLGALAGGVAATALVGLSPDIDIAAAKPKARTMYIRKTSTRSNIITLQYLLSGYGHKLVPDGIYGTHTADAVFAFQKHYKKAYGLVVDGIVGPATMKVMVGRANSVVRHNSPHHYFAKAAQQQFVKLGYKISVDGGFDSSCTSAVRRFQTKHKLPVTSTIGYLTWSYLINPPAGNVRKGPAILVCQSGTGLASRMADCGPASFVALTLRLGLKPHGWTDVAHRAAAISYARHTTLRMSDNSRGTGQIGDQVGLAAGLKRLNVSHVHTGHMSEATAAVRSGGVAMLGGDLNVASHWNGWTYGKFGLHWISILGYSSSSKKYLVAEPAGLHNKLVWVTNAQLAEFSKCWGVSVYVG